MRNSDVKLDDNNQSLFHLQRGNFWAESVIAYPTALVLLTAYYLKILQINYIVIWCCILYTVTKISQ